MKSGWLDANGPEDGGFRRQFGHSGEGSSVHQRCLECSDSGALRGRWEEAHCFRQCHFPPQRVCESSRCFLESHPHTGKRYFVYQGLGVSLLSSQISLRSAVTLIHKDRSALKMLTLGKQWLPTCCCGQFLEPSQAGAGLWRGREEMQGPTQTRTPVAGACSAGPVWGWRGVCRVPPRPGHQFLSHRSF